MRILTLFYVASFLLFIKFHFGWQSHTLTDAEVICIGICFIIVLIGESADYIKRDK